MKKLVYCPVELVKFKLCLMFVGGAGDPQGRLFNALAHPLEHLVSQTSPKLPSLTKKDTNRTQGRAAGALGGKTC